MNTVIVLLRGINVGANNRISMPPLREALTEAGFANVRSYVQSGNLLLESDLDEAAVRDSVAELLTRQFDLTVPVVTRTRDELAEVLATDPIEGAAEDPKRYQVTFLSDALSAEATETLASLCVDSEQFVAVGRELYTWHPQGVARSKLALGVAGKGLGVTATARNWTTVNTLLEMADE